MMTFWKSIRLPKLANLVPPALTHWVVIPTIQDRSLQWTMAAAMGVMLGVYALSFSYLPEKWAPLSLLVVLVPCLMLIVGKVKRLFLAIILLELPIQIDTYLNYRQDAADLNAIVGLNISLTTLCLTILYALWLAELLAKVSKPPRDLLRLSLPLLTYLVIVTISVLVARDVELAIFEISLLFQTFLLYIYIIQAVRTRQDVLFVVTFLLIGLFLQGLFMIGLRGIGQSVNFGVILGRVDSSMRVGGTIGSPNSAASYLTLLLAPALSLLLSQTGLWHKRLAALSFGIGIIALILTLSRGAWSAVGISVTLLCLLAWRRGWLSLSAPVILLVCVLLILLFFQDTILARLLGDDNGSAEARLPLIRIAFLMVKDHPWLGVGANNFAVSMGPYITPEFSRAWLSTVHSKYMLVWAETGTGGLLAFVWFLLATIRRGWQVWSRNDRFLSALAIGFTLAIMGQMIHMNAALFNGRPQIQMLWLIAGLITAMYKMDEPESSI